jgi:simple sugar transport system ATP-binding protein
VPGDTPRDVLGLMMAGEVPASIASTTKESAA